ncbi:MAG: hypothetical protein WDM89_12690 [Rhizomicrobium sp.]
MNSTRNQHFISQVEQRLNACNTNAAPSNQRIFEFQILDREARILQLNDRNGRLIEKNLSMLDLFSFDMDKDKNLRANFEELFGQYERKVGIDTATILRAHAEHRSDIFPVLFDLFVAKLINFIRNPFTVVKAINTFGKFAEHHPTNAAIYESYVRTIIGRRPQQAHICGELGISDEHYKTWLRLLFMLLTPMADGQENFLEQSMRSLFQQDDDAIFVHVHKYNDQFCLLSDRGFSSPIEQGAHMAFDFNLSARAFIRFAFLNYEAVLGRPVPEGILRGLQSGPKVIQVSYLTDDLPALDVFHRRVVEQSHKSVYCAGTDIYSAQVLGL